jgi:hypothetical protein
MSREAAVFYMVVSSAGYSLSLFDFHVCACLIGSNMTWCSAFLPCPGCTARGGSPVDLVSPCLYERWSRPFLFSPLPPAPPSLSLLSLWLPLGRPHID